MQPTGAFALHSTSAALGSSTMQHFPGTEPIDSDAGFTSYHAIWHVAKGYLVRLVKKLSELQDAGRNNPNGRWVLYHNVKGRQLGLSTSVDKLIHHR